MLKDPTLSRQSVHSKPQGLVQLEGLGKFKKFTSSGLELVTFRLEAWYPNHYATAYRNTITVKLQTPFIGDERA
jgi:hypothetical protein